jgi:hypothetical protein
MVQNCERRTDGGNPRLTTLFALAEALQVPAQELLSQTRR